MLKTISTMLIGFFLACTTLTVNAVPFSATITDTAGPLSGGSVLENVIAPGAGSATLYFDLVGYLSVDGNNGYNDTFKLDINGVNLFSGGFNMGGGGNTFINYQDPAVSILSTVSNGLWYGGLTQFAVNHDLLSGSNSYLFDYGYMQGLHDEGWGIKNITIEGYVTDVPAPQTTILFALSLALLIFLRRKTNSAV